jgi:UDP-glucose 4,6-dehydratase
MVGKIALLGSNGYIGSNFNLFLNNKNLQVFPITRKNCDLLDKDKTYKTLKSINPDYIINCAGYTGKPNVDACEANKELCWQQNYTLPKYLAEICKDLNKKWVHISSGCIYYGTKNKNGFTEKDESNFSFDNPPSSYYSGTKAIAEDYLKSYDNVYICRLRIPFNNKKYPKNYITKLLNYNKLLNATNSLSNTEEFIKACYFLISENCDTGIYNITNTGSITTKQVVKLLNKHITDKKFSFFKNEIEFYKIAAETPRSNCILDNAKLRKTGFKIKHIDEAIEEAISSYNEI